MDTLVKISQVIFYLTGAIVAVLTFIKAKNGLLNAVNTEYQKRVMDRLQALSEEIYLEFDPQSDEYWVKQEPLKEAVDRLHQEATQFRHELLTDKDFTLGTPIPKSFDKLGHYLDKVKSDPFIPCEIRDKVVRNIQARSDAVMSALQKELDSYQQGLKAGKYWDTLDTNYLWIHNQVNDYMYKQGVGISQVQDAAHETRLAIQKYLEGFDPLAGRRS